MVNIFKNMINRLNGIKKSFFSLKSYDISEKNPKESSEGKGISLVWDGMQPYRMAIWNSHVLMYMVAVLLMTNIVLVILLCMAYPLKRIEPMLIQAKGKDDVYVTITPMDPSMKGYQVLLESMLERYVKNRESINLVSDFERWNEAKLMSSPSVWDPFYKTMLESKETYHNRMKDQVTREVLIRNISRLDQDLYQVEWMATDKHLHTVLQASTWVSIIRFSLEPDNVLMENRYLNPIGLTVVGYSVSRKEGNE